MTSRRWLIVLVVAACGGTDAVAPDLGFAGADMSAEVCPNDLPADCPSPPPSWNAEVSPLMSARCVPCHSPGGLAATTPLGDYSAVYARRSTVLNQVYACTMPPPDAGTLDERERVALLGWLVCNAPNN